MKGENRTWMVLRPDADNVAIALKALTRVT